MHPHMREFVKQLMTAMTLSTAILTAIMAGAGAPHAADMPERDRPESPPAVACAKPAEQVILYDRSGRPTVPARTPYHYCVTGRTLLHGDIPPPPEYCCD